MAHADNFLGEKSSLVVTPKYVLTECDLVRLVKSINLNNYLI